MQKELLTGNKPYILARMDEKGYLNVNSRPYIHMTQDAAHAEADRLAMQHPGQTFVVLKVCGGSVSGGLTRF